MTLLPGSILLATEGSEEAELAAEMGVELAKSTGSSCTSSCYRLLRPTSKSWAGEGTLGAPSVRFGSYSMSRSRRWRMLATPLPGST